MRLLRANNAEGRELIAHAEMRIAKHKDELAALACSDDTSRELRGRISELKMLIQSVQNNGDAHD